MQKEVVMILGSAENVNGYLAQYGIKTADYIVSGLPFTSLPKDISEKILLATQRAIGTKGRFLTFQYSLVKRKFFEKYFTIAGCLLELKNIPQAYVMVMRKKAERGQRV